MLVQDLGELLVAGVVDEVGRADRARDDEALLAVARLQDRGRALVQAVDVEQLVVDRQADAVEQAENLVTLRLGDVAAAARSAWTSRAVTYEWARVVENAMSTEMAWP